MPDHGRPLRFGVSVVPEAEDADALLETVLAAEAAGLDLVGIQDHPYQRRFLDTWSLIAFLAARTSEIRFFTDVANLPLRPPAVMAKAAATIDRLSGGRFELGLGAGGFWDAIEAMGGRRLTPGQSVDALEEAIGVIRAMWSEERSVTLEGEHYAVRGVHPGPPPAHDIGIWLGAYQPRMLRLVGRLADGWVPSLNRLPDDHGAAAAAIVDQAARDAGRDPAEITRVLNVGGVVDDADRWARELSGLATEQGFDTFVFWPASADPEQVHAFAAQVAPRVRDVVATLRTP